MCFSGIMVRGMGRAQDRNSKTCFMLLRMNLNHYAGDEKAYVLKYWVSMCCRTIYMCICYRTICHHTHTHIWKTCIYMYTCIYIHTHAYMFLYIFIYIDIYGKSTDFSGDTVPLVLACLAVVLCSFAFPATNQNEICSKKACLSNSRSGEAFINPVR